MPRKAKNTTPQERAKQYAETHGWGDKVVERVKTLAADNNSAAQIADQIGKSRASVCAKCRRLGISLHGIQTNQYSVPGAEKRPAPPPRKFNGVSIKYDARPLQAEPPLTPTACLMDLTAGQCKWPIGDPRAADFGFCGRDSGELTYCRSHHLIAFNQQPLSDLKKVAKWATRA